MALLAVGVMVSCGDDDDATPDDGGDNGGDPGTEVSNGFYVIGEATGTEAADNLKMIPGKVDQFPDAVSRSGLFETYIHVGSGSFNLVKYTDGEEMSFGGSFSRQPMADGSDYEVGVGELIADGEAITAWEEGLYHILVDETSASFYLVPVKMWEVIGDATPGGWGTGTALSLQSASADEVVYQGTEITLRGGEYKIRYNSSWTLDFSSTVEGLNMFTNLGGTPTSLSSGGANFPFDAAEEGNYTITVTYTPGEGNSIALGLERTGDAGVVTFDPLDYPWGIIGAATATGWDADTDLTYYDWSGNWVGAFALGVEEFKFRTDENWTNELTPDNTVLDADASITPSGGNFANADSAYYFVSIRTDDEGDSWGLIIKEFTPEIIGDATVTGWDAGTPMEAVADAPAGTLSWTLADLELTEANFKFRMNGQWEIQAGFGDNMTIDGASADILSDGGDANFAVGTAGTYQITLTTTDLGATWTLTIE